MKKNLLLVLLAATSFFAHSQTKGTNALGFGFSVSTNKSEGNDGLFNSESKFQNYSLTYGRFIKDNVRIGVNANYVHGTNDYSSFSTLTKGYGGSFHYQKYFPLLKKFYAFANSQTGYQYSQEASSSNEKFERNMQQVNLGASGGVAYFLSKRVLLEADLLSTGISYARYTDETNNGKATNMSFNLSSSGAVSGLGFKIYFLF
jgi:hypothetical protein